MKTSGSDISIVYIILLYLTDLSDLKTMSRLFHH